MAVGLFDVAGIAAGETNKAYTIPSKTVFLKLVARGGTANVMKESGGTVFTLEDNESLELRGAALGGEKLWFTTGGGITVEIFIQKKTA